MPTLPNMSLITPTLGGDSGAWDDKINAALALIDAHDHKSGKGLAINTSAITIDADLSVAGYSLTSLGKIAFSAITAPVSGSKNLFVNSSDNELYWRTDSGTNVQLTDGASINTALVGGIVGDYSSVGAEVAYDDANDRYTFKQQSGTWARLASGPVRIYEFNTSESVYVEHAVAAALAASYTVTWPAALPAGASIIQISSAGVVSFSNTLPAITGLVEVSDVYYFLGTEKLALATSTARDEAGSHTLSHNQIIFAASANVVYVPIVGLPIGAVITGMKIWFKKGTSSASEIEFQIVTNLNGASDNAEALDITNSGNGTGDTSAEQTGEAIEVVSGYQYSLKLIPTGSVAPAADRFYHAEVYWHKPQP